MCRCCGCPLASVRCRSRNRSSARSSRLVSSCWSSCEVPIPSTHRASRSWLSCLLVSTGGAAAACSESIPTSLYCCSSGARIRTSRSLCDTGTEFSNMRMVARTKSRSENMAAQGNFVLIERLCSSPFFYYCTCTLKYDEETSASTRLGRAKTASPPFACK